MSLISSEKIYSSSALATRQREVKNAASEGVVHITENGNGAYIFCSEEVFEQRMREVREEALYEAEVSYVLQRAQGEFESGEFYSSVAELRAAVQNGK